MTATAHPPQAMLADYAAGTLSRGMTLAVAAHLGLCPCCRDRAARLASLCGALFATCAEPVPPSSRCLEAALARLETEVAPPPREIALPDPLCRCLATPPRALAWRSAGPGLSRCRLEGFPAEEVGLVRAQPGARVPAHGHAGPEATVVLEGGLLDDGRTYRRGDIAFCDETVEHSPEVVGTDACLYLVVASAPPRPLTAGIPD
jgi:putative transcriptional regulator